MTDDLGRLRQYALLDEIERLRTENEKLRGEYETKAAELASLQIAFNDWKVMHSTVRLEVENERLRRQLAEAEPKREPLHELPPLPDYLSPGTVHEYARAVERAAYERAARVCEANENRIVKTHPARIEIDPDSMMARKCAAAIRALGGGDGN